jgi:hypothetical protein
MRRTTLKLREGRVTGGNVALMETEAMRRALPVMARAYAMRKKPLKLAQIVGFGTLFRVALGQVAPSTLPLSCLEGAVGRFLGTKVRVVVSHYPGLGADLDKVGDWQGFEAKCGAP